MCSAASVSGKNNSLQIPDKKKKEAPVRLLAVPVRCLKVSLKINFHLKTIKSRQI